MGPTINSGVESNRYPLEAKPSAIAAPLPERALPEFGHRIAIDAREGVFIVLRTYADRGTVDVLRISGIRQIEAGIPLSTVRVLNGQNSADLLANIDD